ncbi:hypothetical protein BKH43_07350 [Helicobacter sp. 13S00401-1]|uniref:HdrB C-terminal domain-containing protein n=1 Tax=Helicobacter sp. 13S00401-1 TaxID=1905758 RepID=UPI000BA7E3E2|nr:hypothetical protein [Helicobacter sp. 13S00401-1]PAF49053.1 hypothetical protein BKH43_07350 [Helicobacter sp. 13S00401-1]
MQAGYTIYNIYNQKNPFLDAATALIKRLDLPTLELTGAYKFEFNGGYLGRVGNLESYFLANAYNIAICAKQNTKLLALDEDAYANLVHVVKTIEYDEEVKNFIEKELDRLKLSLDLSTLKDYICYLPCVLAMHKASIEEKVEHKFSNFSAFVYYGGRHFDASLEDEYKCMDDLYKLVDLKVYEGIESFEYYAHLMDIDDKIALEESGRLIFAGCDRGVDFLLTFSESTFNMFDKHHSKCMRAYRRDPINISTLNIYQVLLLSFDMSKQSAISYHMKRPKFISA